MPKLTWDVTGTRLYEMGVSECALYVQKNGKYGEGVAWSGISSISESPSGAEDNAIYADNIKFLNLKSTEEFGATIEAYMYPDEWKECDGRADLATGVTLGQQKRAVFGLAYKTKVGNDADGDDAGYKIHLIYGAQASPSESQFSTVSDSPEPATFSWEITTTPITVDGFKPTSQIVIDSTKADATALAKFEGILYGSESEAARLPLPDEVKILFATTEG